MKRNNFDSHIKKTLQDQRADLDIADWLAMNDKLNETFGVESTIEENREFDQEIASKLSSSDSIFNEKHWEELQNKLDEEDAKREAAFYKQIIKAVAILLLFLSLWNWQGSSYIKKKQLEKNASIAYTPDANGLPDNAQIAISSSSHIVDLENNSVQNDHVAQVSIVSTSNHKLISQQHEPTLLAENSYDHKEDQKKIKLEEPIINSFSDSGMSELTSGDIYSSMVDLQMLETQLLAIEDQSLDIPLPLLDMLPSEENRKTLISLNAVVSPDQYLIRSSDDPIYPLPSYMTESQGLSGGLTVSLSKSHLEIETGLLYSSVSYAPREITEQYSARGSFYETSLQNILFNVVSVPLLVKYNFLTKSRNSFFANFGASFNGVINSNFDQYNTPIAQPLAPLAVPTRNESLLSQKDFEPGLLEGGSIFENTYFTLDLGFTYQYKISNKVAAFVQPTIHTQFTAGIGPNVDKLHKLALYGGVKYAFN